MNQPLDPTRGGPGSPRKAAQTQRDSNPTEFGGEPPFTSKLTPILLLLWRRALSNTGVATGRRPKLSGIRIRPSLGGGILETGSGVHRRACRPHTFNGHASDFLRRDSDPTEFGGRDSGDGIRGSIAGPAALTPSMGTRATSLDGIRIRPSLGGGILETGFGGPSPGLPPSRLQ